MKNIKLKGAIFDMDGVIVGTEKLSPLLEGGRC